MKAEETDLMTKNFESISNCFDISTITEISEFLNSKNNEVLNYSRLSILPSFVKDVGELIMDSKRLKVDEKKAELDADVIVQYIQSKEKCYVKTIEAGVETKLEAIDREYDYLEKELLLNYDLKLKELQETFTRKDKKFAENCRKYDQLMKEFKEREQYFLQEIETSLKKIMQKTNKEL
ncbi:hypothetical protein DXA09_22015 [Absiella sp. AM54-8XD]|uniref:hypothetical protein n=1 Tax=Absiella sp. AM54-8XD TaxID=2292279 RepID=UPI000E40096B|nr:hypothetical protein [Absiella sp. AM54-8XD]RGC12445.1 hypothetical protein DXA09_22015 [Absiella sp. AM54-8XD]